MPHKPTLLDDITAQAERIADEFMTRDCGFTDAQIVAFIRDCVSSAADGYAFEAARKNRRPGTAIPERRINITEELGKIGYHNYPLRRLRRSRDRGRFRL